MLGGRAVLACRVLIKASVQLIHVQSTARTLITVDREKAVFRAVKQVWLLELLLPAAELGFGVHHLDQRTVVLEGFVEEAGAAIP